MNMYSKTKEFQRNNKKELEIFQLAITSSIGTLIYSEYIKNFKHIHVPTTKIFIPEIQTITDLLSLDGSFFKLISENIISEISNNSFFKNYISPLKLSLFSNENKDILQTIFDVDILENISISIPTVITKKFGLDNTENQQFIQSPELDIFNRKIPSRDYYTRYIVDQIVLQMIIMLENIPKTMSFPESNLNIIIPNDDKTIFMLNDNIAAIAPIYFNNLIFENQTIMDLLNFVTGSTVQIEGTTSDILNEYSINKYIITTTPFNRTAIIEIGE